MHVDPLAWVLAASGAAGYTVGVRRLAARRAPWPQWRSAAMVGAVAAWLVATSSPLAGGGGHGAARLAIATTLLVYLVPLLLGWAAPHMLAVEAGGRGTARRVRKWLGSGPARFFTASVVAIALAVGLQAVDFLTPLHTEALRHDWVAEPLQVALLLAGCAYIWPVMAPDPLPRRLAHAPAVVHVLVLFPLSTLIGIAIESGTHSPDLSLAGGILWTVAGLGGIAATLAVLVRWLVIEERSSPGRTAGLDEGAHAQLVAWREARAAAAAEEAARREAAASRRR